MGITNVHYKKKVYQELKSRVKFVTFIAHNVVLGKFNSIGYGSVICPNCVVTTNVNIGNFVTLNCGTQVGHDVSIDDYCSIMSNCDLGGSVRLESSVFVGSGATLLPKIKVGPQSIVGAGSVVINSVKSDITVFGNPAKKIF